MDACVRTASSDYGDQTSAPIGTGTFDCAVCPLYNLAFFAFHFNALPKRSTEAWRGNNDLICFASHLLISLLLLHLLHFSFSFLLFQHGLVPFSREHQKY